MNEEEAMEWVRRFMTPAQSKFQDFQGEPALTDNLKFAFISTRLFRECAAKVIEEKIENDRS